MGEREEVSGSTKETDEEEGSDDTSLSSDSEEVSRPNFLEDREQVLPKARDPEYHRSRQQREGNTRPQGPMSAHGRSGNVCRDQ